MASQNLVLGLAFAALVTAALYAAGPDSVMTGLVAGSDLNPDLSFATANVDRVNQLVAFFSTSQDFLITEGSNRVCSTSSTYSGYCAFPGVTTKELISDSSGNLYEHVASGDKISSSGSPSCSCFAYIGGNPNRQTVLSKQKYGLADADFSAWLTSKTAAVAQILPAPVTAAVPQPAKTPPASVPASDAAAVQTASTLTSTAQVGDPTYSPATVSTAGMTLYNLNKWPVGFAAPSAADKEVYDFIKQQVGGKIALTQDGLPPVKADGVTVSSRQAPSSTPYSLLHLDGSALYAETGCADALVSIASVPASTVTAAVVGGTGGTAASPAVVAKTCEQQRALTNDLLAYVLDETRPFDVKTCKGFQDASKACVVCGSSAITACPKPAEGTTVVPGVPGAPSGPGGVPLVPPTPQTAEELFKGGYAGEDCVGAFAVTFDSKSPAKFDGKVENPIKFNIKLKPTGTPPSPTASTTGEVTAAAPVEPSLRLTIALVAYKPKSVTEGSLVDVTDQNGNKAQLREVSFDVDAKDQLTNRRYCNLEGTQCGTKAEWEKKGFKIPFPSATAAKDSQTSKQTTVLIRSPFDPIFASFCSGKTGFGKLDQDQVPTCLSMPAEALKSLKSAYVKETPVSFTLKEMGVKIEPVAAASASKTTAIPLPGPPEWFPSQKFGSDDVLNLDGSLGTPVASFELDASELSTLSFIMTVDSPPAPQVATAPKAAATTAASSKPSAFRFLGNKIDGSSGAKFRVSNGDKIQVIVFARQWFEVDRAPTDKAASASQPVGAGSQNVKEKRYCSTPIAKVRTVPGPNGLWDNVGVNTFYGVEGLSATQAAPAKTGVKVPSRQPALDASGPPLTTAQKLATKCETQKLGICVDLRGQFDRNKCAAVTKVLVKGLCNGLPEYARCCMLRSDYTSKKSQIDSDGLRLLNKDTEFERWKAAVGGASKSVTRPASGDTMLGSLVPVVTLHQESAASLDKMFAFLKSEEYTTYTIAELEGKRSSQVPKKSIAITVDDGYVEAFTEIFPLLKANGFKATYFLITGRVGDTAAPNPKMTWAQVKEVVNSGLVRVESHTHNLHPAENDANTWFKTNTNAAIVADLKASRDEIKKMTGQTSSYFAWPVGKPTVKTSDGASPEAVVSEAGFTAAYGYVSSGAPLTADQIRNRVRAKFPANLNQLMPFLGFSSGIRSTPEQ